MVIICFGTCPTGTLSGPIPAPKGLGHDWPVISDYPASKTKQITNNSDWGFAEAIIEHNYVHRVVHTCKFHKYLKLKTHTSILIFIRRYNTSS